MFPLKIVFPKSALLYFSNQHTAFNKTVGIPQKIPTAVNQSACALKVMGYAILSNILFVMKREIGYRKRRGGWDKN